MSRHSRHLQRVDTKNRAGRVLLIVFIWACGLVAGAFCLLSIVVRYGCANNNKGLGCTNSGSALGGALVLAVILVVTAVTAFTLNRSPKPSALFALAGVAGLVICVLGARALLHTV